MLHKNITTVHTIIDSVNSQSIAQELVINIHSALRVNKTFDIFPPHFLKKIFPLLQKFSQGVRELFVVK